MRVMEQPDALSVIVDFMRGIGLTVEAATLGEDGFLPGIAVRDGWLLYDPDRLLYPGDLLHAAGHIAVTDPALRPGVSTFDSDGGDEMAVIAWSYAAALAAQVDPRVVFHDHGYKGDGAAIAENRTLQGLGIEPTLAASILPSYLVRHRPEGQFTQSGSAA